MAIADDFDCCEWGQGPGFTSLALPWEPEGLVLAPPGWRGEEGRVGEPAMGVTPVSASCVCGTTCRLSAAPTDLTGIRKAAVGDTGYCGPPSIHSFGSQHFASSFRTHPAFVHVLRWVWASKAGM